MPASSGEGICNISAVLENTFKQQEICHKKNTPFNAPKNDQEVSEVDSWNDHILGTEIELEDFIVDDENLNQINIDSMVQLTMQPTHSSSNLSLHHSSAAGSKMSPAKKEVQLEQPRTILYDKERIRLGWHNPPQHRAGMYNLGNTCYLNSSLQALFHIPAFVNWLREEATTHVQQCAQNSFNQSYCSLCAIIKTYKSTTESGQSSIRPYLIVNKLRCISNMFINGRQEDAHEFLKLLLDHMEKSYLQFRRATKLDHLSKQTTPLNQIFGGFLRQQVSCPLCHYVSTTFSHFQDLVLDIKMSSSLDQALDHFFRKETLDSANCYKCERCKKKVPATKRYLIERLPNVLLVQLKRFYHGGGKIGKHVNIQRHLDLGRFVGKSQQQQLIASGCTGAKYRLVSMVVHLGGSQHGGHYIACAEGPNGSLYEFDDSSVRSIGLQSVLLRNPYILFYELVKKSPSANSSNGSSSITNQTLNMKQLPSPKQQHNNGIQRPPTQLHRHNSDSKMLVKQQQSLKPSKKEDLGQEVSRPNASATPGTSSTLPSLKNREPIVFDLKSSNTTVSIPKIVRTSTGPLLAAAPAIGSINGTNSASNCTSSTSNGTISKNNCTSSTINGTGNSNGISTGRVISLAANNKLSSTAYVISSQKKALQQNTVNTNACNRNTTKSLATNSSLVPYDSDSDCETNPTSVTQQQNPSSTKHSPITSPINSIHKTSTHFKPRQLKPQSEITKERDVSNCIGSSNSQANGKSTELISGKVSCSNGDSLISSSNTVGKISTIIMTDGNGVSSSSTREKPSSSSCNGFSTLNKASTISCPADSVASCSSSKDKPVSSGAVTSSKDNPSGGAKQEASGWRVSDASSASGGSDTSSICSSTGSAAGNMPHKISSTFTVTDQTNCSRNDSADKLSKKKKKNKLNKLVAINNSKDTTNNLSDKKSLKSSKGVIKGWIVTSSSSSNGSSNSAPQKKSGLMSFLTCISSTSTDSPAVSPDREADSTINNVSHLQKSGQSTLTAEDALAKRLREEDSTNVTSSNYNSKKHRHEHSDTSSNGKSSANNESASTTSTNTNNLNSNTNNKSTNGASDSIFNNNNNSSVNSVSNNDVHSNGKNIIINSKRDDNSSNENEAGNFSSESRSNGSKTMSSDKTKSDTDKNVLSSVVCNGADKSTCATNGAQSDSGCSDHEDDSDSGDDSGVRRIVAPVGTKVAWDQHTRGDLAYSLSSHKAKGARPPPATQADIWASSGGGQENAGQDTADILNSSKALTFGVKVSTWDDEESQLDRERGQDVQRAFAKNRDEMHNEQLDHIKKKRKKLTDHEEFNHKKQRFDTYIKEGRVENANSNLIPVGGGSSNPWSNGGYDRHRHNSYGGDRGRWDAGRGGGGGRGFHHNRGGGDRGGGHRGGGGGGGHKNKWSSNNGGGHSSSFSGGPFNNRR